MFSTDIEILEKDGTYTLSLNGQSIQCLFSDDLVASSNFELICFICEDFDRCGSIDLNDKKITTRGVNCAYTIFSIQKLKVENQDTWNSMLEMYAVIPKYDYALIQVANGPPMELEELARLTPVREAFKTSIGKKDFKQLTEYAWGSYYHNMWSARLEDEDYEADNELCPLLRANKGDESIGPGQFITDKGFKITNISKKIINLINLQTKEEKAALSALCEALKYKSVILPIALLNNLISKREYVSGCMVLGGGILDLSGNDQDSTDLSHQKLNESHRDIAELCLTYCSFSQKPSYLESLISKGENKEVEFKQTFALDVKSRKKEKYIVKSCIKTIAAFLNTEGGTLLVGVSDDGEILGIEEEVGLLYKNNDKFLLNFKDTLKANIGVKLLTSIVFNLKKEMDKTVLVVECLRSDEEVFIPKNEFYVRTNPATEKLEGRELIGYVKSHFQKG